MFDNGCEWLRCDFHLHTRKDKEFKYSGEEHSFVNDYISSLENRNIKIGLITNHNKFDLNEYKALKKAASKKDIFILPGVELSVKDGKNSVHSLIIFNPEDWIQNGENHINNFLTAAFQGINNRENENTCCNYDLNTLLVELEKLNKDYFIVFAHIEQKSGLIEECGGGRLSSLASNHEFKKRVLGLQKLRTKDNIKKIKDWFGYEVAFVEGSDPKKLEEIGKGKETYIKIGEYSFNALKYALQDYKNRISNELPKINHGYINSISFKGGKLDSMKIPFSNELNTLIGIRGSGKSSVLESIRYALDLNANIDKNYKDDLVKNTLGSGGEISLDIVDKYGKRYEIRRLMNEQLSILDENGKDVGISIDSIISNPLYFGQKDLSFTQSGYAFDLLQKLIGNRIKSQLESIDDCVLQLVNSVREFFQLSSIPSRIEELQTRKKDLEKGVAEKLKKQTSYNNDFNKIEYLINKIDDTYSNIKEVHAEIDENQFILSDYKSEFNDKLFVSVDNVLKNVLTSINNISAEIENIAINKNSLELLKETLASDIRSLRDEFASIKRDIQDESIDPDIFVKYTSEYNKVKQEIEELTKKNSSRDYLILNIKKQIRERNEILSNIFNKYYEEIKKINESQNELEIRIYFKGNKDKFKKDIKAKFKGTKITEPKIANIADEFSDFVSIISDSILDDSKILRTILTDNLLTKVQERIQSNYEELIREVCPDLVEIYYHNKLLEHHSIGQRASALILFVLTQEDNDLIIIDQPEDDLDNQIIYEEVISTIKRKKPTIQFIFATHNANIPVLGDAECVIATQYNDRIDLDIGNIDCSATHKKIVDIMEGGKEAFEKRKLIYTNWNNGK